MTKTKTNWLQETLLEVKRMQENINEQAKTYAAASTEKNKLAYADALCEASLYLESLVCKCTHDMQYKVLKLKNSIDEKIRALM